MRVLVVGSGGREHALACHAAERGQSEVPVHRFPNPLCSDRGRRINNSEPDWEATLDGRPKCPNLNR